MRVELKLIVVITALTAFSAQGQETLSLRDYQEQVKRSHLGFKAATSKSQGARERQDDGAALFSPTAFSEVQYTDDQRGEAAPTSMADRMQSTKLNVGLSKQSRFGTTGKVYYSTQQTEVTGANQSLMPEKKFYDTSLNLELSQPLWKNAFGSDLALQEETSKASAQAASASELYQARLILAEAESVYWRLAFAQEQVRIQKESLDRSKKITDWQKRRASQNLIDNADLIQAQAALKMRELEVRAALNENALASKAFNEMRDKPADDPVPALSLPTSENLADISAPKRASERGDVVAARHNLDASRANINLSKNRQKPSLDLFGIASVNGKESAYSEAASDATGAKNPLYTVGLRFSVPLDQGRISSVREGYTKEIVGAELSFEQKKLDQINEWTELNQKLEDTKERLKIILELEKAQKMKFDSERDRFNRGRSTTYQIFLFEQDYLNAQLSRAQTSTQLLNIVAQLKTFEDGAL